jgi:hypothetical protein
MRPRWGKANKGGDMSKEGRLDDKETIDTGYELPPSPQGTYRYEREDGTIVHGGVSGEWTLAENGEVEDVAFVMSAGWQINLRRDPSSPPWRRPSTLEHNPERS